MKLDDFKKRQRQMEAPSVEPPSAPKAEKLFRIGIDLASAEEAMTGLMIARRRSDGSYNLEKADVFRELGAGVEADPQSVALELMSNVQKRSHVKVVGPNILARAHDVSGAPWGAGIAPDILKRIFASIDTDAHSHHWVMRCDGWYDIVTLYRYVGSGTLRGKPIVYVQRAADSGIVAISRAEAVYPAETIPCDTCEGQGIIDEELAEKLGRSGDIACPYCTGFGRRLAYMPKPSRGCETASPITFASANPTRTGVYPTDSGT